MFYYPTGVAIDPSTGDIFVADTYNHAIRMINISSGNVSTFSGNGNPGLSNGPRSTAQFNYPYGIAIDPSTGNIFVADTDNVIIRMINISSDNVTTFAGIPGSPGYLNGPSSLSQFNYPFGIAVNHFTGSVIVADTDNQVIRSIDIASGNVSTLAGSMQNAGHSDGPSTTMAQFFNPYAVAVDPSNGNVFVADTYNAIIRLINISSNNVSTVAGIPLASGFLNGEATLSQFNSPTGLVVVSTNETIVYVADSDNQLIRSIEPISAIKIKKK